MGLDFMAKWYRHLPLEIPAENIIKCDILSNALNYFMPWRNLANKLRQMSVMAAGDLIYFNRNALHK